MEHCIGRLKVKNLGKLISKKQKLSVGDLRVFKKNIFTNGYSWHIGWILKLIVLSCNIFSFSKKDILFEC